MPVREKKYKCGNYLEINIYHISKKEQKKSRKRKKKESRKEQKNLNDKNAKKNFRRLLNANFDNNDYVLHGTFNKEFRPKNEDELRKYVTNYLARVKRRRKKLGLPELKYVYVIEMGERGAIHVHIVMSGGNVEGYRNIVEDLWKGGRVNADRLQLDEFGLKDLASYLTKDPKGKKRWSSSRNLIHPEPLINDYKYSYRKLWELATNQGERTMIEKLYPGYTLSSYESGENEITGRYVTLMMRKRN